MAYNKKITHMVQIAFLAGIELVLAFTPLGYIPIGPVRATTIHIPVILGGILLGPSAGAVLGGIFGLSSILINTITPTITSFVFSPFYTLSEARGNIWSIIIALIPRILIGVVAGWSFRLVMLLWKNITIAAALSGFLGSMTNTILVMGGIYVFFGPAYAAARGIAYSTLVGVIGGVISFNGVIEAIAATVISVPLTIVLHKTVRYNR